MRAVRIAMVSLALAAAQVHAGIFDDEEARKSIAATQARLDGLSKTLDARMTTLEQQSRQRDLYVDLDSRLRKMETVASAGAAPAPATDPNAPPPTTVANAASS